MLIEINELQARISLGVLDWERAEPRTFCLNLAVEYDATAAAERDDVKDALDYRTLESEVLIAASSRHFDLLESLVVVLGNDILKKFPEASNVFVEVTKPAALPHSQSVTVSEEFVR